jgi:hypothetical protein
MPKYGLNKYGRFKYGKYVLSRDSGTGSFSLGPHVRYRVRNIQSDGTYTEYLTMCKDRMEIKGNHPKIRLRTLDASMTEREWVYTHHEIIGKEIFKARVRSIDSNGNQGEWVYSDKGTLS